MLRSCLLWLFGVACGIAISFGALMPERAPGPATETNLSTSQVLPGSTREIEQVAVSPVQVQQSIAKPAIASDASRPQFMPGEEEVPLVAFELIGERNVDPEPDAEPHIPGAGPLATLICEYRSTSDETVVTRSSGYDAWILPPPSCPFEIQLPAPPQ